MENTKIQLEDLSGKWHIVMTNFPMWTKGNKTNPTFNYSIDNKRGKTGLRDKVTYLKNGKEKSILGFDYPANTQNTAFVWRGKGILSLLKSKWEIVHYNKEQQWIIIHFQKTLFTPEGYDVISTKEVVNKEEINAMIKKLHDLGLPENLSILKP